MKTNVATKKPPVFTHEGAKAFSSSAEQRLRRAVMSCLLWEKQFYEDGEDIADRICSLVAEVKPERVAEIAAEAREKHHLRHVPLLLICALAERRGCGEQVERATFNCIERPDELAELVSIWWRDGRRPLPAAMKRGLARAFGKFNAYQLAKYNRDAAVRLRDVMFLVHPKPQNETQAEVFKALADKTLAPPDTWEVALSAGADKKETFERLLRERKLGYLALLRNLRNMAEAGCDDALVREAIVAMRGAERVLPFRYVAAARACPQFEPEVDLAMQASIASLPRLPGRTAVMVDVSGSMDALLSSKSDMDRMTAAAALASIVNCEHLRVFSFSNSLIEVPPRRGMAGIDAIVHSQQHGGTLLGASVQAINEDVECDRLIVITDEQSHDAVPEPRAERAYMVNVASYQNGVGYGRWTRINGFSENVIRFIHESET